MIARKRCLSKVLEQGASCKETEEAATMFQCIIQPRNGVIHNSGEMKGVFPGANFEIQRMRNEKRRNS